MRGGKRGTKLTMDRKVRLPSINPKKSVHFDEEDLYGEDEESIMALLRW